jgi:hypothetical protein
MPARLFARALAHLGDLLGAQVRGWLAAAAQVPRRAWAGRPTAARAGAILLALGLAGLGLGALLAQAALPTRLPSAMDWRAVAALLQRDGRPGDAVLLDPAWLERAREVVPPGLPVLAPLRLGAERIPGVRRVWLLTAPAERPPRSTLAQDLGRQARAASSQRLGALEVTCYELGAPLLPFAALTDRAPPGTPVLQRDAGGTPRRCLALAPAPERPVTLAFPGLPLGRALAGHALLLPGSGAGPVRVAFQVDGAEVGALELGGEGWRAFELETNQAPGAHTVTVTASAEGAEARPVCLEALAIP